MRVAKAQQELTEFYLGVYLGEEDPLESGEKKIKKLREKYEIPDGVFIFERASGGSAFEPCSISNVKPHFSAWVKGKLTSDQCMDIYWYFEEVRQADWGWIMLERPMGYYQLPSDDDQESIRLEMISIGTRSRSKNSNLQELF